MSAGGTRASPHQNTALTNPAAGCAETSANDVDLLGNPRRDMRERELLTAYGQLGDASEVLRGAAAAGSAVCMHVRVRLPAGLGGALTTCAAQVLNERAVTVMKRMSDKLTGRDFLADGLAGAGESDTISSQVQRLIAQATSHENLCQSYIGWCPFW